MVLEATVALLASLDKTVATDGAVKEPLGLVPQTVVHAMLKGQGQIFKAARRPKCGLHGGRGRSHDALVVGALALLLVVVHPKVVTHLVSHSSGHKANHITVPHVDPARELIGANGAFEGLADDPALKLNAGQELGIVIGMILDQPLFPVVQEVLQGRVPVGGQGDLVVLCPHDNAHQGYVDVERGVQGVHDVGHVLADPVDQFQILFVLNVLLVIHDQDKFNISRPLIGIPRSFQGHRRDKPFDLTSLIEVIGRGLLFLVRDVSLGPNHLLRRVFVTTSEILLLLVRMLIQMMRSLIISRQVPKFLSIMDDPLDSTITSGYSCPSCTFLLLEISLIMTKLHLMNWRVFNHNLSLEVIKGNSSFFRKQLALLLLFTAQVLLLLTDKP
jgi:hypothetical protein